MSLEALSWAAKQNIKSVQKLTLMMLANRHNADTGQCNPSHTLLAKDCGLSDSGVRKAVRELAKLGLIKIISLSKNGVKLPNQYVLNTHLNITEQVGHMVTEGGSHGDDKTVIETVKETVKETVRETKSEKRADAPPSTKPKKPEKTFAEYLTECTTDGKDFIPDGSEPEKVAERLELSAEMLDVFWQEFRSVHLDPTSKSSKKRQADWLQTISNYLRKNYFELWGFDRDTGLPFWTQKGLSMFKAMTPVAHEVAA